MGLSASRIFQFRDRVLEATYSCPSCHGTDTEHLDVLKVPRSLRWPGRDIPQINGCRQCGLIFIDPPPAAEHIAAMYAPSGIWNARHDPTRRISTPQQLPSKRIVSARGTAATILHHAKTRFGSVDGLRFFDFGCGAGSLLGQMKAHGMDTCGMDPATRHIVKDHPMIDAIPESPTFDIVSAVHSLEHMIDPMPTLMRIRGAIKPNGLLYIGVPTLDGLAEHRKKRYCINARTHFCGFTRHSLTALLGRARFKVIAHYRGSRIERMRFVAEPVSEPVAVNDPLHDARLEFFAFRTSAADVIPPLPPARR